MGAWDWEQEIYSDGVAMLPQLCQSNWLAINISAENQDQLTSHASGYLEAYVELRGSKFVVHRQLMSFGDQLIEIPYSSYRVHFEAEEWLRGATIKINELSELEIKQIMGLYPSASQTALAVSSNVTPSTFASPAYSPSTAASAYQALSANPQRLSFSVTNTGNVSVYLDIAAPTALLKRMVTIPAGGVYVDDTHYVGAVYIWSGTTAAQPVEIREFLP